MSSQRRPACRRRQVSTGEGSTSELAAANMSAMCLWNGVALRTIFSSRVASSFADAVCRGRRSLLRAKPRPQPATLTPARTGDLQRRATQITVAACHGATQTPSMKGLKVRSSCWCWGWNGIVALQWGDGGRQSMGNAPRTTSEMMRGLPVHCRDASNSE